MKLEADFAPDSETTQPIDKAARSKATNADFLFRCLT
jgi:hypothetical protein